MGHAKQTGIGAVATQKERLKEENRVAEYLALITREEVLVLLQRRSEKLRTGIWNRGAVNVGLTQAEKRRTEQGLLKRISERIIRVPPGVLGEHLE